MAVVEGLLLMQPRQGDSGAACTVTGVAANVPAAAMFNATSAAVAINAAAADAVAAVTP